MRYLYSRLGRGGFIAGGLIVAIGLAATAFRGPARAEDPQAVAQANAMSRAFRAAAQQIIPTVVMIKTTTKPQRAEDHSGEGSPSKKRSPFKGQNPFRGTPFEDFFDDHGVPDFGSTPYVQEGVGSGVIIDPSGVILTNAHVVEGADEVLVELADGRQFKASDIREDEQTDLAVLRIKADGRLPAARLGDSSKMEIGDWVLAVGNPFELEHTVSAGIISGMKRVLPSGKRADYLQTDAAINPGNSGGPLVNLDGEVVGINTAIASNNGGYQGIGFAIPSNLAKWVTKQLIDHGSVARAYLGVSIADISNDLAAKLGVHRNEGALVNEVFPDTPAAAAGFQEGDVITAFAGTKVKNPHELQALVEQAPFGSKQRVDIIRDRRSSTLDVEVKAMPKKFGAAQANPRGMEKNDESEQSNSELGIQVSDLTPEAAKQLDLKGTSGALITGVTDDGPAAAAGLRQGMVVLRVGKTPIKNAADFKAAMKKESVKNGVLLLVRTNGGNRFIVIREK